MQYKLDYKFVSEDELLKAQGLNLDFDEAARKGGLTRDDKKISKWYGIYGSRHPGSHMARVVIPGGVVTSTQARAIARVSETVSQGKVSVTTRQALQFHWLKSGGLPDMLRMLLEEALSTFHGCGDVTRNVTACPLAENCQYRRLDARKTAKQVAKYLTDARDLDDLPRKFKVNFSGCGAGCAQSTMNCIGANAVVRKDKDGNDEYGWAVNIGGGMGWRAFKAQELFSFVPDEHILHVCRAVAILFRDHGNRRDRTKARLKFVVHNYGIEKCRDIVLENMKNEAFSTEGIDWAPFEETGKPFPERPLLEPDPKGTDGLHTITAVIPMGELDFNDFRSLAEISEIYGDKKIYTTNRQNIQIRGVRPELVAGCKQAVEALGFKTDEIFTIRDIVTCVGTRYCPKAVTKTHDLYRAVMEVVKQPKYDCIKDGAIINITGCPNSCSPYRISDIGFRGMRIREEMGSVEGYEMLIGGTDHEFGKKLGEFKFEDCPKAVEAVLDAYIDVREGDETLAECVKRTGFSL